jgi:DNA-binding GntR family transcriptional regulator
MKTSSAAVSGSAPPLTQSELMALLDVPVGPLREALQVLESEGLLTMLPRSGIRIVKPDMTLMKNNFQLRRILECEAVRKYAERAPAEELAHWEGAHRGVVSRAQSGMAEAALLEHARTVDHGFQAALIGALRNPQIEKSMPAPMSAYGWWASTTFTCSRPSP